MRSRMCFTVSGWSCCIRPSSIGAVSPSFSVAAGRGYSLKTRSGAKAERRRFDKLGEALAALERRGSELQDGADARIIDTRISRRFEPVQQGVAGLALAG